MPPVEVRPFTADDLPAVAVEVGRARTAGAFRASADPDADYVLKSLALDPRLGAGAFDAGELVGFVSPEFKVISVRPDRRRAGIGRALIEVALELERDRGRPDVLIGLSPADGVGRTFLEATGFTFHSHLWDLDLPRDVAVGAPSWPAGTIERPFDRARDVESWIALFNVAFADHPTPLQLDPSFIVAGLDDPSIADADTGVVEDTSSGELIGFCATSPIQRDGAVVPHGEIWTIGVRPDRQGGGLGRQLLRWGVRHLRSIGVPNVSLSVNARNERALRLYVSEGFVRSRARERWARSTGTETGRP